MTTWVAVDPWLFEHDAEFATYRGLVMTSLFELVDSRPHDLSLLPILDAAWFERRRRVDLRSRSSGRTAHRVARLMCHLAVDGPVRVTCLPPTPEDVGPTWHHAIESVLIDANSTWRDPVVLIPEARRAQWACGPEIALYVDGDSQGERVLAVIEAIDEHPFFLKDLDPWRCEEHAARRATDQCARTLPRPPCTQDVPMMLWRERLNLVPDHGEEGEFLYFIPSRSWDPLGLSKIEWREHPFGGVKTKIVNHKHKKGPRDESGRTWAWDEAERHHWDVQCADEKSTAYDNVNPDGFVRSGCCGR